MLTEDEIERYKRHLMLKEIGGEGQQRLKASRVLVVGAGGLGSPPDKERSSSLANYTRLSPAYV